MLYVYMLFFISIRSFWVVADGTHPEINWISLLFVLSLFIILFILRNLIRAFLIVR